MQNFVSPIPRFRGLRQSPGFAIHVRFAWNYFNAITRRLRVRSKHLDFNYLRMQIKNDGLRDAIEFHATEIRFAVSLLSSISFILSFSILHNNLLINQKIISSRFTDYHRRFSDFKKKLRLYNYKNNYEQRWKEEQRSKSSRFIVTNPPKNNFHSLLY